MKRITMFALVWALALGLTATNALAIQLTDASPNYLGLIDDGIPPSPALEATYINNLLTLALGAGPTPIGTETYTRSNNACVACPLATAVGAIKDESSPYSIDLSTGGFTYLLGKYGNNGSLVWDVRGISEVVTVQSSFGTKGGGLSHISAYNPGTTVPDGGMTLMLLGGALVGLESLRRRFRV